MKKLGLKRQLIDYKHLNPLVIKKLRLIGN